MIAEKEEMLRGLYQQPLRSGRIPKKSQAAHPEVSAWSLKGRAGDKAMGGSYGKWCVMVRVEDCLSGW